MERQVKRVIGYLLLCLVGSIEAAEWISVLHEHIPAVLFGYINQPTALIIFIVGILLLYVSHPNSDDASVLAVAQEPVTPVAVTNEMSPTTTISPNITVINNPPPERQFQSQPVATTASKDLSHNVQYARIREYTPDGRSELLLAACFENVPVPNRSVRTFNDVKIKVDYKDCATDATLLSVFPSAWAEEESDHVYMSVGKSFYATIAMRTDGVWNAVQVVATRTAWGEHYDTRTDPLPVGDFVAVVTLVGDHGLSIAPERFHLRIGADGTANISHLSHDLKDRGN
jgi:hypothetical protein